MAETQWYWCLSHQRAEPEGEQCGATDRLGPYASREEAANWRERRDEREREWKAQDKQWGDEPD